MHGRVTLLLRTAPARGLRLMHDAPARDVPIQRESGAAGLTASWSPRRIAAVLGILHAFRAGSVVIPITLVHIVASRVNRAEIDGHVVSRLSSALPDRDGCQRWQLMVDAGERATASNLVEAPRVTQPAWNARRRGLCRGGMTPRPAARRRGEAPATLRRLP